MKDFLISIAFLIIASIFIYAYSKLLNLIGLVWLKIWPPKSPNSSTPNTTSPEDYGCKPHCGCNPGVGETCPDCGWSGPVP